MTFEIEGENYGNGKFLYSFAVQVKNYDLTSCIEFDYDGDPIDKTVIECMMNGNPFIVFFKTLKGGVQFTRTEKEGDLEIYCAHTYFRINYEMHAEEIARFAKDTLICAHDN